MQHFNAPFAATPRPTPVPLPALAPETQPRRPRLLVRAARFGAGLYRRERHLGGLLPGMASTTRRSCDVIARLAMIEAECEAQRRAHAPDYAPRRHVAALSALLAERAAAEAKAAPKPEARAKAA